jgi:GT2 family glycosyltransferase
MTLRIGAVLVTYQRPHLLPVAFERLAAQERRPDALVLVDNDPRGGARSTVRRVSMPDTDIEYLNPGDNTGPAGGFALGMQRLLGGMGDEDVILLLDDNDPLPPFDVIRAQLTFLDRLVESEPAIAGVGLRGASFDWRTGRTRGIPESDRRNSVRVDHLHGGGYPMYRVGAVRRVGAFSAPLFFGFEELEYGLRLTTNGYGLQLNQRLAVRQSVWRRRELEFRAHPALRVGPATWRRYYSLRNLLHILLLHGRQAAAIRVAAVRGVGKPVANMVVAPRLAAEHLRWNRRAVSDAFGGRMGRTVDPSA